MLTSKSWKRAATTALVAGLVTATSYGPAVAEPGGQGTPPAHSAAAGGPPGQSPATPDPAAPAAPAGEQGKAKGHEKDHATAKGHAKAKGHDKPAPAQGKGHGQAQGPQTGKADPPRHTPVTVCHVLGNGGYHLLTMDDSALKAHQNHGDLYPVPAGGCPAPAAAPGPEDSSDDSPQAGPGDSTVGGLDEVDQPLTADDPTLPEDTAPQDAVVLGSASTTAGTTAPVVAGVEQVGTRPAAASVLGVQQTAAGTTATGTRAGIVPAAAPAAGILPQTGAGPIGMLLAGAGALLAAGVAMLRRRRAVTTG